MLYHPWYQQSSVLVFLLLSLTEDADPHPFRGVVHGGQQAVHVVSSITIITEQQLIIVICPATKNAFFTFHALPPVGKDVCRNLRSECETRGVCRSPTVRARYLNRSRVKTHQCLSLWSDDLVHSPISLISSPERYSKPFRSKSHRIDWA